MATEGGFTAEDRESTECTQQGTRAAQAAERRDAKAGFWQTVTLDFTAEMEFTEAKNRERRS